MGWGSAPVAFLLVCFGCGLLRPYGDLAVVESYWYVKRLRVHVVLELSGMFLCVAKVWKLKTGSERVEPAPGVLLNGFWIRAPFQAVSMHSILSPCS